MTFKKLDKVWVNSNSVVYPGIVLSDEIGDSAYIVLKFDTAIWRRVVCIQKDLSKRKNDFNEHMYSVRKNFLNIPLKFQI